jgi:head-tail adaptor
MKDKPFIGQMNRLISIIEKTITQSSTGGETTTNTEICKPFAHRKDTSGNEEIEGKVIHQTNRSYIIRINAEVKTKSNRLIVIDEEKEFPIFHVKEIGKTHLELLCTGYE